MWNGTPSTVAGLLPLAIAWTMASPVSRAGGTSSTPACSPYISPPTSPSTCTIDGSRITRSPRTGTPSIWVYRSTSSTRSSAVRPITFDGPVDPELSWTTACEVLAG
jgi:hypothetical protein